MPLTAQTISRSVDRQLAYTLEHIWPGIQQNAFDASIASYVFFAEPVDASYGGSTLVGRGKDTQTGGIKVHVEHEFGRSPNTKRLSSRWDTFLTAAADLVRWSEANWRDYSDAVTISKRDELENVGSDRLASMIASQSRNAVSSIVTYAVTDLFSGSIGTAITGLDSLIGANDSVQGLSGATYAPWNSWGLSGKNTAAGSVSFASGSFATRGLADMRTAWVNCTQGTMSPHCIFTTEAIMTYYQTALTANERWTSAPTTVGDPQFAGLAFNKAPLYGDVFATSGVIYFVNLDATRCVFLAGADFQWMEPVRAANQEATTSEVIAKMQMVVLDRRLNNKLTGVTA